MYLNLNQFRTFFLTAKQNSVTKAADILHITQADIVFPRAAELSPAALGFVRLIKPEA